MPHPITDRIHEVKRTARAMALLRGIGLVGSFALATALLLGSVDYLCRLEDTGTRTLLALGWWLAMAWAAWRWLWPVLRASWTDRTVAQMIERRFPQLADKLSSSLAFLSEAEAHEAVGSKQLMRNVIAETTTAVSEVPLLEAMDWRPTRKSLAWLGSAVLICCLVGLFWPAISSQAVSRLMTPWKENPWPRVHHLRFVDPPSRISRGSDLELRLVDDRGRLPSHVNVQLWYDGDAASELETVPMMRVDEAMLLERTNITRPFRYRAVGGDDQRMQWTKLDVVDPPQIVSGATELRPPDYTGWLPRTVEQPLGPLRVLEGTSVAFRGKANRPLKAAMLRFAGTQSEINVAAHVKEDRYRVPPEPQTWSVEHPGEYSISLVDIDDTETVDADLWNVRVLGDEPPRLTLTEPDSEELVTPNTVIAIRCNVEDDLAIRRVELRYLRTDQSDQGELSVSLLEGPATLAKVDMPSQLPAPSDQREVVYQWPLDTLRLAPGVALNFYLLGEDYKLQASQTLARRLVVVSDADLLDRVGRRQSLVLSRLQQQLEQQRRAKSQVDAVRTILVETNTIDKSTMDRLQSGLIAQGQVNAALFDDEAQVVQELRQLTGLLDRSRIGDVDIRGRIAKTLSSIEQLGDSHLEPALRHGTSAQQTLQAMLDRQQDTIPADVPPALKTASDHQTAAIAAIEELLDEMSAWDNYRKFAQDLNELLRQQSGVRQAGQEIAQETITRREHELDGQQRAALSSIAAQQMDLARRMDRTLANLAKGGAALVENDPPAAQMLRNALEAAREAAVSGRMRQAGQLIDENKLGLASQEQASAERALETMLDELSRRGYSREERSEKLEDVGRELQRLQKQQSQLSQEFQQAQESDTPQSRRQLQRLAKRQEDVAREIRKLERQLQRLGAVESAQRMGQAASSTESAASAAQQGSGAKAQQQSQLAEQQLEQARQSLQQAEQQAKSELAQEQMVRLPQLIDALVLQQASVVDEIARLDQLREQQGELTDGQQTSVAIAAEAQRAVSQSTNIVAEQMSELPAFVFALQEIRHTMEQVALSLDERNLSSSTHDLAQAALSELELIREMLRKDQQESQNRQQAGGNGDNASGDNLPAENIDARLAQLKLLREMQLGIQRKTKELNAMTATDENQREARDAQLTRLATRQDNLAKLVSALIALPADQPPAKPIPKAADKPAELDALDQQLDLLLQ